jgi:beta-glucoside operon transcriptional antiterminator
MPKEEYQVGKYAIAYINQTLNVSLPKDEATSIAFHFIVASQEKTSIETREIIDGVNHIVDITVKYLGNALDEDSLAYSRYIIHVKFFLSKIISHKASDSNNTFANIFSQLVTRYENVEKCIKEISDYIKLQFNYICTEEDCIYLMIHIVRLYELQKEENNNVKN